MMDKKMWEKQYPEMPEIFHLALEQAVNKNVEANEKAGIREEKYLNLDMKKSVYKSKKKKWRLLVLAAVLCGGISAVIAVSGQKTIKLQKIDFQDKVGLGERTDTASVWQEDIIVRVSDEPEYINELPQEILGKMQKLETDLPLISIDKVMYDGLQLAVCAYPTKETEGYEIESWTMTVNGKKTGPNEMDDNMGKQDYFIFTAQLYDTDQTEHLDITLPLNVYGNNKRYENQELQFSVDTKPIIKKIPDQIFHFDNYTVKLTEMKRSLTAFFGKIYIERTSEQEAIYKEEDREITDMFLEGMDGNRWEEIPLREDRKTLAQDRKHEEGYFYYEIPEDGQTQVKLQLMSRDKEKQGEKWDFFDADNQYGDAVVIDMK